MEPCVFWVHGAFLRFFSSYFNRLEIESFAHFFHCCQIKAVIFAVLHSQNWRFGHRQRGISVRCSQASPQICSPHPHVEVVQGTGGAGAAGPPWPLEMPWFWAISCFCWTHDQLMPLRPEQVKVTRADVAKPPSWTWISIKNFQQGMLKPLGRPCSHPHSTTGMKSL